MSFGRELVVEQHFFVFQATQEFDLSKLLRLKTAGRIQLSAKGEKVRRKHRFQDGELFHQDAHDFCAASKQACGFINTIARRRISARGAKVGNDRVQIVQQFLEPELVGLMNDDEQQFVVMYWRGDRVMKREQLRDAKIGAIRQSIFGLT